MNDGAYFANVDSQSRKVDIIHIDRETMEFEHMNRATKLRLRHAAEMQNKAQRVKIKKQRTKFRLVRFVLNCTVICLGMGACVCYGLANWHLAVPVMTACLAAGAWRIGRDCQYIKQL